MGAEPIIIHVDTERSWRGGQQQVAYLLQGLVDKGISTALICQPHSTLEKYFHEKELPCFSMKLRGELDLIAGYRIARLCRKLNSSTLHLHSAHALAIGLWAKFFNKRLKLIAVRRVDFHINKNIFSKIKYTHSYVDKIVCISKKIQEVLLEDGLDPDKMIVIHSGIDTRKYSSGNFSYDLRSRLGIPENHIIAGTVAAIAGHKDYPNLLRAAEIVLRKSDSISFVAVGDGPDSDKIMALAEKLNLGQRFIFVGFQKNIGYYLNNFDLFIMASKKEGMGTSILDAQSVGLPIVACASGGIPEIVTHSYNGLLVAPRDSSALAEAIIELATDVKMREKFAANALQSVQNFTIEKTIEKNILLYDNISSG